MIKKLVQSLREYTGQTWATVGLSGLEVVFEILIPLCMADLIDQGIQQGDMAAVWRFGAILLALAVAEMATGFGSAYFAAHSAAGFSANLRQDMYDDVQGFAFSNIDRFSVSSIVTRLTTDVTNVQNAMSMLTRLAIRGPLMMVFAMVASFSISRSISLVFLALIPVMGVLLYLIVRRSHPIFQRVFNIYDQLNGQVQEDVKGIRVVKAFVQEDAQVERFDAISQHVYEQFAQAERLMAFNSPIMQTSMYVCMILIAWFGSQAIVASGNDAALGLTTGDLTALISYAMQILTSLMMLSMVFVMITIARSSGERIVELLDEKSDIVSPADGATAVADGSIDFEHVDFRYNADSAGKVLDGIDLHVASGQTIGILGPTGSAKSTLVQLIPRLYDVSAGTLKVGGVDVRRYDLDTLRQAVAMVLQKNELFSGTVRDNLRWGNLDATDQQLGEACRTACADEFIAAMPQGYDTVIEQGGTNVSGGQKQRLCLARALLKKPKVLIMDDSTSAVDTRTDAQIQANMKAYLPQATKIVIAQRVSSVQTADQILVMDNGRIAAIGTHQQLLASNEMYRSIYESQNKKEDEHHG